MAGNKRRLIAVGAAAVLLIGGVGAVVLIGRSGGNPGKGHGYQRAGRGLAAGLDSALNKAATLREPYRCAALPTGAATASFEVAGRRFGLRGYTLTASRAKRGGDRLILGVLGDARGGDGATMKQLETALARFERRGVELIITVGGMGTTRAELVRVLGAIGRGGRWPVIALPGDRESLPAHRAAIAAIGKPWLVDGSRARIIEIDGVVIGTFPGVGYAARLQAGADGCAHGGAEARALAAIMAGREGVKVWASYAPPRQQGSAGSDRGADNVHVGELGMTAPVERSGAALVVHGQVDRAALGTARGRRALATGDTLHLASGPIEAMPVSNGRDQVNGSALVVEVRSRNIAWSRLRF
jgi:hypothetical protein